jgi:tripartite-type tricarboxylate transporter receptor subunit TctC
MRRLSVLISYAFSLLVVLTVQAHAQNWPSKPIKVITSATPGGVVDIYARRHSPHLQTELGQPILVENKPGASGAIAGEAAATASPDGYSVFIASQNELGLIGLLGVPVHYDADKDFTSVGLAVYGYPILLANPQIGAKNVSELVAHTKTRANSLDCASSGVATVGHFVCTIFAVRTGTKVQFVPYKGTVPAMTDAASGQVQLVSAFYSEAAPFLSSGRLIPLGVFGPSRLPLLPNVPTMAEQGLRDTELQSYTMYAVPTGTPVDVQRKLNAAVIKAANQPDVMEKLKAAGGVYLEMGLEETQAWQKKVQSRWSSIARETGIKLEK